MLFRLLTGKPPFSAANGMAAVMMAHLQQPPPRVTDLVPSLPATLDAVIATAMAKDPAARFPSAAALAEAAGIALSDRTSATALWLPVPSREVSSYPRPDAGQAWWQRSGPRTAMAPPGPLPYPGAPSCETGAHATPPAGRDRRRTGSCDGAGRRDSDGGGVAARRTRTARRYPVRSGSEAATEFGLRTGATSHRRAGRDTPVDPADRIPDYGRYRWGPSGARGGSP